MKRTLLVVIICCLFIHSVLGRYPWLPPPQKPYCQKGIAYKAAHCCGHLVYDALRLGVNLFSMESVKVLTGFAPLFIITRRFDESLHMKFYDDVNHKNINQLPQVCHTFAKDGIAIPMLLVSGLWIYGWNDDLRQTGRMAAIGIPFVQCGKDLIKQLRLRFCLRPWHENFSSKERASGGFPSGHMATAIYVSSLMWMRHGPQWGVPLTAFAVAMGLDFLNCNRHYLSQMVAGAGLGLIFAYAANKVIDANLAHDFRLICRVDHQGASNFGISYHF